MANPFFRFKQFTVNQDKTAMKVGTDGVLLGAWAPIDNISTILDIGTGTGVISLMLAQRSTAIITAIDIDKDAVCQARENFKNSPWEDRLQALHVDFNEYTPSCLFDLIVSNPPYFIESLKSPHEARSIARHDESLTYYNLFKGVRLLLHPQGVFSLIIPADVTEQIIKIACGVGLHPYKQVDVITSPGKLPKRSLLCFGQRQAECEMGKLLIETERHCYSEAYISLTKDFYLKM